LGDVQLTSLPLQPLYHQLWPSTHKVRYKINKRRKRRMREEGIANATTEIIVIKKAHFQLFKAQSFVDIHDKWKDNEIDNMSVTKAKIEEVQWLQGLD
jgi:hypothetical protein